MADVQDLVGSEPHHWEWTGSQWALSPGSGLTVTQVALELDNLYLEAATVPLPASTNPYQVPAPANETLPLAAAVILAAAASAALPSSPFEAPA